MTKQKIISMIISCLIVIFIIFSIFQQKKVQSIQQTYFYLGTIIDITLFGTDDTDQLLEISKMIFDYDAQLDRTNELSEVSKINHLEINTPLEVSSSTYDIIKKSLEYGELSDGNFDITINPIVELWQIGTDFQKIPAHSLIEEALPFIGYNKIELLPDNRVQFIEPATIDLGAIAKGFIADEIVNKLRTSGIEKALINLGGNVYALGNSPSGDLWNIGIRHPEPNAPNALLKVMLEDKSVVTSGITERYFEEDGIIYHHIFDPRTGYPIQNDILSLTVISDLSIDGDALSTTLFALGYEKAFELVKTLDDVQIIVVTKDKTVYINESLSEKIELFDDTYTIEKK